MNYKQPLNLRWLMLMAWRDSRRNRSRLLLFVSSIILGIAALVAVYSLSDNLKKDIDNQAAALVGADLEISGNKPAASNIKGLLDSLGDRKSEERSFASMIYFLKNNGTRLVQVRALKGDFPYYGRLETQPVNADITFRKGRFALVDKTLMLQYNASVGDSIKVGNVTLAIAGTLLKAPGQTGLSTSIAPAVYIPLDYLSATGLQQKGSRIRYVFYYKYDKPVDIEQLTKTIEPRLEVEGLNYNTVALQKESTGRFFADLTKYLAIVGFVALLLGCIGVASAIHIYVREKINSIAVLRCLGANALQAFLIYLIQIVGIGFIGSVIGSAVGVLIQKVLPLVLKDVIPVDITTDISLIAIAQGIVLGIIISLLFGLLPLVSIRNVSPLNTLRLSFQSDNRTKDVLKYFVYGLIVLFIFIFTYIQLDSRRQAIFFTIGIFVAFLVLAAIAKLLMWLVRHFFPDKWNYLWRQGLANLYRPNNQTIILIVSIGLGTAFICLLFFIQTILLNRVTLSSSANQPNIVLFDIQTQQKDQVVQLAKQFGLPATNTVPVVNMRLESINGITAANQPKDTSKRSGERRGERRGRGDTLSSGLRTGRLLRMENRVTYRDSLTSTERITAGKWTGTVDSPNGTIYISLEQGFANGNKVKLGDTMVFNVQGVPITTIVGSFRDVEWNRMSTNFRVLFPKGVLEDAPQFHVLLTRVPSNAASAKFQQAVVRQFPNVSIIDLALVLSVIDDILQKIGFVIRFMAGFSIITGLVVLIASVLISKYQRIQESVLLRTIGASRKQIFAITAIEYLFLGAMAAATGIILSLAGSWALAHYIFETTFTPQLLPIVIVFISVCLLTVIIGVMNSREILTKPPMEVLRRED